MTAVAESPVPGIRGRLGDEHGSLPLVAVEIEGDVCGVVATTVVRQTFRNTRATALEATYVFPLPDRAGVTSFVADLAGRVVEGRLDERGRARQEYDTAIAAGHRAAIAEEDRPGVFTMRVGNLQPAEEAVVTLTLTGPLPVEDGVAEYRFPLVVAPRYVAGEPLAGQDAGLGRARDTDRVPDASRVTPPVLLPGQDSPVRLSLTATLAVPGLTAEQVTSTLHDADVEEDDAGVRVRLRPGERLDRDVLLRWPVAEAELRTSAVVVPDADGEQATWQVTVLPPQVEEGTRPRDVVVVLDRSGSMGGWKMVAARRAAARIVDTLGGSDRFAVLAFDHHVEQPSGVEGLQAGSDGNRWQAVSWLAGLDARGGTEMLGPLHESVRLLAGEDAERDRYVVLVTDGQVAGEDEVLRALAPAAGSLRLFTLGVDRAVNAGFLRRLAALGGGRCDLVESEERLDDVLAGLHRRICPPLATGLTVTVDGAEVVADEVTPARAPDLFPGVPVTIAGRLDAAPAGDVTLTVTGDGVAETVRADRADSTAVRTVWARARVRDLEDAYAAGRGSDELADRIVATSLAQGVLSRFTAFVAVDRDRRTATSAPQQVVQPVELPSGWTRGAVPMTAMTAMADTGPPPSFGAAREAATSTPQASAAPAGPQAGGRAPLSRLRRSKYGVPGQEPPPPADPVTSEAYLRRVRDLLARLDRGEREAGLADEADQLLDDVASVGLEERWVAALQAVAHALRTGHGLQQAVTRLREVLPPPAAPGDGHGDQAADLPLGRHGDRPTGPPRRPDFWRG